MLNASELIPVATGLVAVLSTWIATGTRLKAKQVEADLKNEAELLRGLMGSQEAMRFQIEAAVKRESEMAARILSLESQLKDREMALRELSLRYEALKENYSDLAERHRQAESDNRLLRDEILKHYLEVDRRKTMPPPPKYP